METTTLESGEEDPILALTLEDSPLHAPPSDLTEIVVFPLLETSEDEEEEQSTGDENVVDEDGAVLEAAGGRDARHTEGTCCFLNIHNSSTRSSTVHFSYLYQP